MSQKIVRMPSSLLHHCYELGEYVRETETRYVYRPKQSRSLGFIPKQMAHVEPCPKCAKND